MFYLGLFYMSHLFETKQTFFHYLFGPKLFLFILYLFNIIHSSLDTQYAMTNKISQKHLRKFNADHFVMDIIFTKISFSRTMVQILKRLQCLEVFIYIFILIINFFFDRTMDIGMLFLPYDAHKSMMTFQCIIQWDEINFSLMKDFIFLVSLN